MGGNKFQPTPAEQGIYAFVIFLLLWTFLNLVTCMSEEEPGKNQKQAKALAQVVH